jgi:hypothetical protein
MSFIVFPGVMLLLPTYPLPVQVGYAAVLVIVADGSIREWRSPEASGADRLVAALAIAGVMLAGLLFILMAASTLHQIIHRPGASAAPLA